MEEIKYVITFLYTNSFINLFFNHKIFINNIFLI